jgi:hypothetical protein
VTYLYGLLVPLPLVIAAFRFARTERRHQLALTAPPGLAVSDVEVSSSTGTHDTRPVVGATPS